MKVARETVDDLLGAVSLAGDIQNWPWSKYWIAAQAYHACGQRAASQRALETAYDLLALAKRTL